MSTAASIVAPAPGVALLVPGIAAALSFSVSDVLGKIVFASGMDVLSLVTLRGIIAAGVFWLWLRASPPSAPVTPRIRLIALVVGVMFAATVFGVLLAIQLLPLSVAILAYFTYPLLTGIAGAAIGLERLGWRGFTMALAAFCGLALMLGTHHGTLVPLGLIAAFGAAIVRVASLLLTRAALSEADTRLTTWYSLAPSALLFIAASLIARSFHPPLTMTGWLAFAGMGVTTTLSTWWIFVSTARVGAFRTAMLLNLEPVVSSCLSFAFLGEAMSAPQVMGGIMMVVALCGFQVRR